MRGIFKKEREVEEFIIKNQNRLYKIAYIYAKNKDDALDIVSESIVKTYKNMDRVIKVDNIEKYIVRIVINTAVDFIRKNSKIKLEEVVDISSSFNITDINYLVDSLSDDLKTVIILKYFEKYKIREIAEILNIPESKVKNRLHKALKVLRIEIEEGE
ncbi:RNA polymerase sigma factor [Clostridium sp. LY3-2]|uniref:RNA polymerase sigma factor n=1 Tax=Clostridium sp. LY3-2 TaxID=2942482 RepID=UPI00215338DE|nr:RNA polymerase sigma factor [Clostridium sp. LY3-2]MCR6516145.1 RNA polymerase sigma factor [Clostridium sp. LY3-2]